MGSGILGGAVTDNANASGGLIFRLDINGLRALAVLAVVGFHFAIPPFRGGFVGVDVFFVISGYLMTGIICSKIQKNSFSLSDFYLARARRILPPLIVMVVTVIVAGYLVLLPDEYLMLAKHSASSVTFLSNILYWREIGYFDPGADQKFLLHTWSLSVEWHFYILYPICLTAVARFGRRGMIATIALLSLGSFALLIFLSWTHPDTGFYLLPPRAWEMLVGGAVFFSPALRGRVANIAQLTGLALIVGSALYMPLLGWPSILTSLPVFGAALVLLADRRESILTGNAVFQWVGRNSYSIYLWHWPIVVYLIRENMIDKPWCVALGLLASFLLGHLSWRFIEQGDQKSLARAFLPALALRRKWQSHLAFSVCVGLVVCASAGVWYTRGVPQRFSSVIRAIDEDAQPKSFPGSAPCFSHVGRDVPDPCVIASSNNSAVVTLLGDSHAESSLAAVVAAIPPGEKGGVAFNAYGLCPPVIGGQSVEGDSRCGDYISRYVEPLTRPRTRPVILAAYWPTYDNERFVLKFPGGQGRPNPQDFRVNLLKSACSLARGGPTYIVLPLPEFPFWVSRELQKRLVRNPNASEVTISRQSYDSRNRNLNALFEKAAQCGVKLLDPKPYFCDSKVCIGSVGKRALFRDESHLSDFGARRLVPMYRQVFDDIRNRAGPDAHVGNRKP